MCCFITLSSISCACSFTKSEISGEEIEASKRAERERKFSAGRQDKVVRLLAAAKLRDSVALEREEVIGKLYTVEGDRWKKLPESQNMPVAPVVARDHVNVADHGSVVTSGAGAGTIHAVAV